MSDVWYAFYIGDYLRDTAHLSMVEHGAYRLLMDHYYARGRGLSTIVDHLYRICRATTEVERQAVDNVLNEFFIKDGNFYVQKRIEKELEKSRDLSQKRRNAVNQRRRRVTPDSTIVHDLYNTCTTNDVQTAYKQPTNDLQLYIQPQPQPQPQLQTTSTRKKNHKKKETQKGDLKGDFLKKDCGLQFEVKVEEIPPDDFEREFNSTAEQFNPVSATRGFDILEHLTSQQDERARETASLYQVDYSAMVEKFNQWVSHKPPSSKYAGQNFNAWLEKYLRSKWQKENNQEVRK